MVLGPTLIAIGIVAALIFAFIQLKNFRIITAVLIMVVAISYFGFVSEVREQNVEFEGFGDFTLMGKIYFNWLGGIADNVKKVTGNALKLDWGVDNESFENLTANDNSS